jgi:hypothetical protein
MSDRDDRLRELLRDTDPARGVPELGEGETAWLRQRVLRAARERRAPLPRRAWVLAGAAALLALAIGLLQTTVVDRPGAPPAPPRAPARAERSPHQGPSSTRRGADGQLAPPSLQAASATASEPHSARPATDATPTAELAARGAHEVAAAASRPQPSAKPPARRHPRATGDGAEREPAIAQAAVEHHPYQLQLTAPGGTRIVWVLAADNGR